MKIGFNFTRGIQDDLSQNPEYILSWVRHLQLQFVYSIGPYPSDGQGFLKSLKKGFLVGQVQPVQPHKRSIHIFFQYITLYIYIYIHIYIYIVCVYIYIYILYIYIYIVCVYIYIYIVCVYIYCIYIYIVHTYIYDI